METQEPSLRHGDQGADGWVEYLQGLLRSAGESVEQTGVFDDATLAAVQHFQLTHGCVADGVVGNQTWAELRDAPAEMAATDGLEPHTHAELGPEARWVVDGEVARIDREADELKVRAVNVGDGPLDVTTIPNATAEITTPDGTVVPLELLPKSEDGQPVAPGAAFDFVGTNVSGVAPGRYTIVATLPSELSGETSTSHVDVEAG
ncbi:MAG: peptidoglycan-binding protein [Acidimicrobiia bacterium]|nr:peptidoglycan-binding protein [Acidimicrobiia bacterium]